MKYNLTTPSAEEQKRKAICLKQLANDRQRLLMKWPFIGGIIMRMELIPVRDDRLVTAATDGDRIFVDINFYGKLDNSERLFVLAHEVWHCVFLHFARRQNRKLERFNYAADLEIHFALQQEHLAEPFVLPHKLEWRDLPAEEIYERLEDLENQGNISDSKEESKSEKSSHGKTNAKFGEGDSSFDKHLQKDSPGKPSEQDSQEGEETIDFVIDEDYEPRITSETTERVRSRVIASAQQVERLQGKLPAHIQGIVENLQKPSLPWQELLKQFVTTCYGGKRRWLPPARRHVWQDLYLPSMRDDRLNAVVALDTSGSTENDLSAFFGELISLMKSFGKFELTVIQCDAKIQQVEIYNDGKLPPSNHKWGVSGLGGTDFRPVFEYVKENFRQMPDQLIFFTDGYGEAPSQPPPYPVMWVLTSDGKIPARWGRSIHFKKAKEK